MQDRFKFRFWRKNYENKWVEVSADLMSIDGSAFPYDNMAGGAYCYFDEVITEQCTGLKDKNGKLIYEGDILEDEESKISYVVWANWILGFVLRSPGSETEESEINGYFTETAVIGNIHENPELLGEEIK